MGKIIFLTEEIIKAGGIVRVVNMWANYFAQKENDTKIIAGKVNNPYYKFDDKIKIKKWSFAFQKKIIGIPYNIIQTYRLFKSFKNEEDLNIVIDRAIHVEPIWFLRKLGLFKNINLIYFAHGGSSDFRDFYMSRPLVKHRVKMMFDAFDKVICLFDDEDDYPKEIKREKLHFIANPLPFEPSDIEFSQKENIVLSLGRVTKEKGIDTLIKAWQKVEQTNKDWKLQIVGDGKDKKEFIALSKKLDLKNVGFIDGTTNVKSYYEKAKIFVIPSLFEGMPMTLLEAMACKCCVVSSKTAGGNKLVENNKTGLLFNIGGSEALAKNIIMLMNDENIQKELSLKAFEYVKQYHIDNISEKWYDVLV
jgi:glycosyltransferase involved in cell wall biosynthesis